MNTDKPILELMDEFLANHDVRENSRKKHRDNLHFFIGWLTRNADVKDTKRSDIIRYKNYLLESGRSPSTVDNYLVSVRQFYNYLEETGVHDNIAIGVHSPKRYYGYRKECLQPDQVARLLQSVNRSGIVGLRDYAIINLMVRTGMRCIEVARSDVRDLKIENGVWVIYIQGKGSWGKDRALGLTNKVVRPISEYIRENNLQECSPLFLNHAHASNGTRITTLTISKIVKRYLRQIGIDTRKISAHSLRHTAAISAIKAGATILDVQSMLGHRSVETTMIYQRSIEEERRREGTAVRFLDDAYNIRKKNDKNSEQQRTDQVPG
jgi:integrase/recombinase XerC/integrase/recombinase XerD